MSLFGRIFGVVRRVAGFASRVNPIVSAIGGIAGGLAASPRRVQPMLMAAPGIGTRFTAAGMRTLPTIAQRLPVRLPQRLPPIGRDLLVGAGGAAAAGALLDRAGRGERKRVRRINPLNHRAARRAIRRICAVRNICSSIERQLPRAASRRSTCRRRKACR